MIRCRLKYGPAYCRIGTGTYSNGRLALYFYDSNGTIAVATLNVVDAPLARDEIAVKTYSENVGADATLIEALVIEPQPERMLDLEFVQVPVYRLTKLGEQLRDAALADLPTSH